MISIIILLVAAMAGYQLSPSVMDDTPGFLKSYMLLVIFTVGALINLFLYVLGAFGGAQRERRPWRRFWP
ncbi:MAG TPA: hypothetical protein VKF82_12750 [Candidatus Eremiobacteraceae bacterium]|nr:hypothetical protein [Candidatus Eremiobacteraceae bacterium]